MTRSRLCVVILPLCALLSCTRGTGFRFAGKDKPESRPMPEERATIAPAAILQAGELPLWFLFTENGPELLETIDDACNYAALIPWPLTPHVRFVLAHGDDLMMAVNRDGFLCLSPREGNATGLYRVSGGDSWRRYTVGAFVEIYDMPVALLYRDDRFVDSGLPLPSPRLWTFDLTSPSPKFLVVPPLDIFSPEGGWDIDILRRGPDGYWYFRAIRKNPGAAETAPDIWMFRNENLEQENEEVSLGVFRRAALPEPFSAAPTVLRAMLAAVTIETGYNAVAVISPEFQSARFFASDRENEPIPAFYRGRTESNPNSAFLLTTTPQGRCMYQEMSPASSVSTRYFSLPSLPEGFVYTWIGMVGNTIFASWEEQDGYSVGAAGFMVIIRSGL